MLSKTAVRLPPCKYGLAFPETLFATTHATQYDTIQYDKVERALS